MPRRASLFALLLSLVFCVGAAAGADLEALKAELNQLVAASKHEEAILVAERVVAAAKEKEGEVSLETAEAYHNLGITHVNARHTGPALENLAYAIGVLQKLKPPQPAAEATTLDAIMEIYWSLGEYKAGIPLARRRLVICRQLFGDYSAPAIVSLNKIGNFSLESGSYDDARTAYSTALEIGKKVNGVASAKNGVSIVGLATVCERTADYVRAEGLYRLALELQSKEAPESKIVAGILNNLGGLYIAMRDGEKAYATELRSLRMLEKISGPDALNRDDILGNLANAAQLLHRNTEAEEYHRRTLAAREKVFGPEHPITTISLSNLATFYYDTQRFAEALTYAERCLAIREKAGQPSEALAHIVLSLGTINEALGRLEESEKAFQRCLELREKLLGPEHPDTADVILALGGLQIDRGRRAEALELARRGLAVQEKHLQRSFHFGTEQQRLAIHQRMKPYFIFGPLGSAPDLAQAVLRHKALVIDSMLEDRAMVRAAGQTSDPKLAENLHTARQKYAELVQALPPASAEAAAARERALEQWSQRVQLLEAQTAFRLGRNASPHQALEVTVPQVQQALEAGQVLVEFIKFGYALSVTSAEERYGAVLITRGDEPRWVLLGAAKPIEQKLGELRKNLRPEGNAASVEPLLRELFQAVWNPIAQAAPVSAQTFIISPESELNFLSFATLLDARDRFLGSTCSIRYVSSGRDLLATSSPSPAKGTVAFGNPDLNADLGAAAPSAGAAPLSDASQSVLEEILAGHLPGAIRECEALRTLAPVDERAPEVFLGAEATEARLRALTAPRILHLAVHGFYLPQPEGSRAIDAMYRSGLVLAGAERTLSAWAGHKAPSRDNDGVLVADEVGSLNLGGTWLVTLSACSSGEGDARVGEGVLGLRRGFIQAGTQNLLSTLWSIDDAATAEFMGDFYTAALKSTNAPAALAETQAAWLEGLRKKVGVAGAVYLAGPFILTARGPQK